MSETIHQLPLAQITPDPNNPRQSFDQDELRELADSIKSIGLETPISVRPQGDRYMIIQGHRRFYAHQLIEAPTIEARIREIDESEAAIRQIIENLQRADLTPIEEARGFKSAMDRLHINQSQLAKQLGIPRLKVNKAIALLNTDEAVQQALLKGEISAGHGEALVALDHGEQVKVLTAIKSDGLSVAETRRHIRAAENDQACSTSNTDPSTGERSTSNTPDTHQVLLLQKAVAAIQAIQRKLTANDIAAIREAATSLNALE